MYGMIHQAAREMATGLLGEAAWRDITAEAGLDEADLLAARLHDDAKTFALLRAVAARAGVTEAQALRALGQFWIGFASSSSYGSIMHMCGDRLDVFLRNLDRMHDSIQSAMPGARMPSFEIEEASPAHLSVAYYSDRTGLEPFVIGLFEGLLKKFGRTGQVRLVSAGAPSRFEISYAEAA